MGWRWETEMEMENRGGLDGMRWDGVGLEWNQMEIGMDSVWIGSKSGWGPNARLAMHRVHS